jgi:hypothetical protein
LIAVSADEDIGASATTAARREALRAVFMIARFLRIPGSNILVFSLGATWARPKRGTEPVIAASTASTAR